MTQTRQLAAIMFTDIVGYTALMGKDEERAFHILKKNREIHTSVIDQFRGKLIKELGDGVMASFDTVTDAVQAAIKILHESSTVPDLQLRIGVHLGEVVFENEDVFGDGVNIAARIQAASQPGSILVSEAIHDNVSNKSGIETRFVKQETLKHVKVPIRMYEVVTGSQTNSRGESLPQQTHQPKVESIAVLPFINMSNDPEQAYFCDGIAEEIIDTLAQLNNLRVIARTSAFAFKGKHIDVREIGKTLDVTSLLEGSVRKSGNRVRITTKLLNVADGSHLWTNRYDRELEDIFDIQEDIATNVATELKGILTSDEKEMIKPLETNVEAYQFFLKGRHHFHELDIPSSKMMFERAIEIDPDYAPAYAGLSKIYTYLYEWAGGTKEELATAESYCQKALSLSPEMSIGHSAYGYLLTLTKRYDEAEVEFNKAIHLDPNSFDAYYLYGRMLFSCGKIPESAAMFQKASEVRLEDFQSVLLRTQSLQIIGDEHSKHTLEEGIRRVEKQLELNPNDRRALSLGAAWFNDYGNRERALTLITKAIELYPEDAGTLFNGACLFAQIGDKDKALDLLEVAYEKGFGHKEWIEHDPDYDPLREEPRFIKLIQRIQKGD